MKWQQQTVFRSLAITGMCAIICANLIPHGFYQTLLQITGCVLMLPAPVFEGQLLFVCLQIVAGLGASLSLLPIAILYKALLPTLFGLCFIVYLIKHKHITLKADHLGCIGTFALGIGYGVQHPAVYLIGGVTLAIYSTHHYRSGIAIALYWAILNVFFTFAVLYNIANLYFL